MMAMAAVLRRENARKEREGKGGKNAQLSARPDEQAFRIGDKGRKIGHRADADEDKTGINAELYAQIHHVDKAAVPEDREIIDLTRADEHFRVKKIRAGHIGQEHSDGDRQKQERFIALPDGQIHQHAHNGVHDEIFPPYARKEPINAGALQKIQNTFPHKGALISA